MSDTTLNRFVASGDTAARLAFTPTPPTPASGPDPGYLWWDTDLAQEFAYNFGLADWVSTSGVNGSTRAITFAIDGGGSVLTTGIKADVYVPYDATITAVTMLADPAGAIVVDIWKDAYGSFPPDVTDTIIDTGAGGTKPTITATNAKSQSTTLTGWDTAILAGDTLRFKIDSVTSITRLNLTLTVTT